MSIPVTDEQPHDRRPGDELVRDRGIASSKRALLSLSRSIESLAGSIARQGEPVQLLSLFQEAAYLEASLPLYQELSTRVDVVTGIVGRAPEGAGVPVVELPEGHALGQEWTVLLTSGRCCAGLVATDLHEVGLAATLEAGRRFAGDTGTAPDWVAGEVRRVAEAAAPYIDGRDVAMLLRGAAAAGVDGDALDAVTSSELSAAWARVVRRTDQLQAVERLAMTDPLTGALNRRFLDAYLAALGPRSPRIGVVAFDFDAFKQLNDTHGHAVGDEALRLFADVVRTNVRASDVLVRLGGDEWLLLLPGLDEAGAVQRVRSVFAALEKAKLSVPDLRVRASAGVSSFAPLAVDLTTADAALYAAKENRSGIEVASSLS